MQNNQQLQAGDVKPEAECGLLSLGTFPAADNFDLEAAADPGRLGLGTAPSRDFELRATADCGRLSTTADEVAADSGRLEPGAAANAVSDCALASAAEYGLAGAGDGPKPPICLPRPAAADKGLLGVGRDDTALRKPAAECGLVGQALANEALEAKPSAVPP